MKLLYSYSNRVTLDIEGSLDNKAHLDFWGTEEREDWRGIKATLDHKLEILQSNTHLCWTDQPNYCALLIRSRIMIVSSPGSEWIDGKVWSIGFDGSRGMIFRYDAPKSTCMIVVFYKKHTWCWLVEFISLLSMQGLIGLRGPPGANGSPGPKVLLPFLPQVSFIKFPCNRTGLLLYIS